MGDQNINKQNHDPDNRLDNVSIREIVHDTLQFYYNDCSKAIVRAEVAAGGYRIEGLTNEIYACMHHIARGILEEKSNPVEECGRLAREHLKRILIDSYKIGINSSIHECNPIVELAIRISTSPAVILISEMESDFLDGIRNRAKSLKDSYYNAKMAEDSVLNLSHI